MSDLDKTAQNGLKVYNGFYGVSLAKLARSVSVVLIPEQLKTGIFCVLRQRL